MNILEELDEAVKSITEICNRINKEAIAEIYNKAPIIIHQRLCTELVNIAKKHEKEKMNEVPEFIEMLKTIEIIEKLYPSLKTE